MQHSPLFALPGVLALAAAPALAADLFVAPGGGPSTFATIGAAVAAAAPGDQIYVAPGQYVEGFTIDKSVSIFAEPGAVLRHPFSPLPTPLIVRDLGAGDSVVISGLRVNGAVGSLSGTFYPTIRLIDNAGSVVLHALDVHPLHFSGIVAENSARVLLLDSTLTGTTGFVESTACQVQPLVRLEQSTLFAAQSQLVAAPATGGQSTCLFAPGAAAIQATDSRAVLADCEVRGGTGGFILFQNTPAGPAVRAISAEIEFRAGTAEGGAGASGTAGAGASAAVASAGSLVTLSVDSSVVGGAAGDSSSTAPPFSLSGGASVVSNGVLFPQLDVVIPVGPFGSIGQPVALGLNGHPGDRHFLFLSPAVAASSTLPFVAGEFLLDPVGLTYLGRVALDGAGAGEWNTVVPSSVSLIGSRAFFQTLAPVGPTPAFGNVVLVPITG